MIPKEPGVYIYDSVSEHEGKEPVRVENTLIGPADIQFVVNENLRFVVGLNDCDTGIVVRMSTNLAGQMAIFPEVSNRIAIEYVTTEEIE